MSDALDFLVKTRPEAMGHYFAFMKDAGRHLDPKTRNLISVITKVHSQTERGLKQYLKRALREGATPLEVVDALLMAFPALGLAKITWAIDVMLSMKLPGFDHAAPADGAGWHDLMAEADLPPKGAVRIQCDGRAVFVARGTSGVNVYDSHCPHQGTDIPELGLQGGTLTCPKHGWAFDVASGDCVKNGTTALTRHETRIERGRVLAHW